MRLRTIILTDPIKAANKLNLPHTKDVGHSYTTFVCVGLFRALPIPELMLSARLANLSADNTR